MSIIQLAGEQIETYLYTLTYDLMINVVNEKLKGLKVNDEEKRILLRTFINLLLSV